MILGGGGGGVTLMLNVKSKRNQVHLGDDVGDNGIVDRVYLAS